MRTTRALLGAALLALVVVHAGRADHVFHTRPATCPPGCQIVEEIQYQEVTCKVCKRVPDVLKKTEWVYSQKSEDYCTPRCGLHGAKNGCGACADTCAPCGKVRTKCLLVKKQVTTECPTTKCVVETTVVDRIPCTVYRIVPCGTPVAPPSPGTPAQPIFLTPETRP